MMPEETLTENLFSYGTLQDEEVQLATFGRRLKGLPDALVGYKLMLTPINDKAFIDASGAVNHRNLQLTGDRSDVVEGTVFELSRNELELADAYEPSDYQRERVRLRSGLTAWVYLNRAV
jgi:gamma-glutamylcyclotransferase (GGCT)/AIG2-like uncharacterized protein YtfP